MSIRSCGAGMRGGKISASNSVEHENVKRKKVQTYGLKLKYRFSNAVQRARRGGCRDRSEFKNRTEQNTRLSDSESESESPYTYGSTVESDRPRGAGAAARRRALRRAIYDILRFPSKFRVVYASA